MDVTLMTAATDGGRVSISAWGFDGSALWRGTAQDAGLGVDVELEVRDELDWRNISVGPRVRATAQEGAQNLVIRGFAEDLDLQGVLTLRVAGGLVLIDTVGEPPLGVVGREIALVACDVEIYPTKT